MSRNAVAVGIERQTTRVEFDTQQRADAADSVRRSTERSVL